MELMKHAGLLAKNKPGAVLVADTQLMGRVASTQKVALADLKSLAAPRMISSDSAVEVVSELEVGAATLDLPADACILTMRVPCRLESLICC